MNNTAERIIDRATDRTVQAAMELERASLADDGEETSDVGGVVTEHKNYITGNADQAKANNGILWIASLLGILPANVIEARKADFEAGKLNIPQIKAARDEHQRLSLRSSDLDGKLKNVRDALELLTSQYKTAIRSGDDDAADTLSRQKQNKRDRLDVLMADYQDISNLAEPAGKRLLQFQRSFIPGYEAGSLKTWEAEHAAAVDHLVALLSGPQIKAAFEAVVIPFYLHSDLERWRAIRSANHLPID
jgi:hypothetical protein